MVEVLLVVSTITEPTWINTIPVTSVRIAREIHVRVMLTSCTGKVGMRHFHLTRQQYWKPTINLDKVSTEEDMKQETPG